MKLLIFDVGGVLRDSSLAIHKGFKRGFESQNLPYKFESQDSWNLRGIGKYNGSKNAITALMAVQRSDKDIRQIFHSDNPEVVLDELIEQKIEEEDEETIKRIRKRYKEVFNSEEGSKLISKPDNLEMVMKTLNQKYKLAVWTNSRKGTVERDLPEIADIFEVIMGGETGIKKPSPKGIIHICNTLEIDEEETGYVGDSVVDIKAAKRAGSVSIALLTGMGLKEHLEREDPDYIFKDLEEMSNSL